MSSPRKVKKTDAADTVELEESDFDAETQKCLDQIETCQNSIEELDEQASEEILAVEQKFNMLRKPHFDKRAEFISKVPHFWGTAFTNIPELSSLLDDNEEDCINHLVKIEVDEFEDIKTGYRIDFYFAPNPYFENIVLTKELHLGSSEGSTSTSTPIKWKEDMCLEEKPETQAGSKRKLDKITFFSWYNNHSDPASDNIAEIIKDELWRNPLTYFLLPDVDADNEEEEEEDGTVETSIVVDGNEIEPGRKLEYLDDD